LYASQTQLPPSSSSAPLLYGYVHVPVPDFFRSMYNKQIHVDTTSNLHSVTDPDRDKIGIQDPEKIRIPDLDQIRIPDQDKIRIPDSRRPTIWSPKI
jgi:hypothetical protein